MKRFIVAALAATVASAPAYADCLTPNEVADHNFVIGEISTLGAMLGCTVAYPALKPEVEVAFRFHQSPAVQKILKDAKTSYIRVHGRDPDRDDYFASIARGAMNAGSSFGIRRLM